MTPKDRMIESWYKALELGLSKLIKNGLAFTVMGGVIAGLVWGVFQLIEIHRQDRIEWRSEKMAIRAECAEEISRLRVEVYECNERHMQVLREVAQLKISIKKKR